MKVQITKFEGIIEKECDYFSIEGGGVLVLYMRNDRKDDKGWPEGDDAIYATTDWLEVVDEAD